MDTENPKEQIKEILNQFSHYSETAEGKEHIALIKAEKKEVNELMEKLKSMNKNDEFVDLVLYGLLPYYKTKFAKRVSIYPTFMNIKPFFKKYNYGDEDWKNIANKVFDFCLEFQKKPGKLKELVEDFVKDNYSRRFQCGTLTPILYCLNADYPVVNNRVKHAYKDIMRILGGKDEIQQKLMYYPENIQKLKKFVQDYGIDIVDNYNKLDMFCYWYDEYVLKKRKKEKKKADMGDAARKAWETRKGKRATDDINIEEVNVSFILNSIDPSASQYEPHSLRPPDRVKIRDIILNAEKRWKLPNFQRYFDWTREDIRDFLESIFYDYYVGAFLFWEVFNDTELDTIEIEGVDKKIDRPEFIILDGQQRITSLYYAAKAPDNNIRWTNQPSYFYINFRKFFDKNNENSVIEVLYTKYSEEECYIKWLFPFYRLENYQQWIYGFENYLMKNKDGMDNEKITEIRRIIERRLQHFWDGFEIPYIRLPTSMRLRQVTDIFERINTRGKPLNVFDLLIARLSIYGIKLRDLWDATRKKHERVKRYFKRTEKIPIYVLQAISLFFEKNHACSRQDTLDLYNNVYDDNQEKNFVNDWNEFAEHLDVAIKKIENIKSGYGVKDQKEIPFMPMLPILAALLKEIERRENKSECYKKLDIWYWSSVFSNAYSSSVDSRLTQDFKEMLEWFKDDNKIPRGIIVARREIMTIDFRDVQSHGSAMFKGILSMLALNGAKDFDTELTLENAKVNHLDHIFPKGKRAGFSDYSDIDSILNITWMSKRTNEKIKECKKPSVYIKEFINDSKYKERTEQDFKEILKTHFINDKAYEHMLNDNFEGFIETRQEAIKGKIREIMGIKQEELKPLITPENPFTNKLLFEETVRECFGYVYWVDKYFSKKGLEILAEATDPETVKEIKIIMSVEKADDNFRSAFKDFREEMKNKGVKTELRVIIDSKLRASIHDRWILSKNKCFNIPSPDTVARGQYSEIKTTENRPPFDEWWHQSKDIIQEWNQIKETI